MALSGGYISGDGLAFRRFLAVLVVTATAAKPTAIAECCRRYSCYRHLSIPTA